MIQRIQTVFLALAVVIDLLIFFSPLYGHAVSDPSDWIGLGFAGFLTIAMSLALISIFLFNNRTLQLKWVKASTYFQIAALGVAVAIVFTLGGFGRFLLEELLSASALFLSLGLLWMAGKRIKQDQELVDSMDRIR